MHDGWRPYRAYDVVHACATPTTFASSRGVGVVWNQGWANEMIDLFVEAKDAVEAGQGRR